jgi:hypothetical protein
MPCSTWKLPATARWGKSRRGSRSRIRLPIVEGRRINLSLMMTMVLCARDPPVTVSTLQPMQIPRLQSIKCCFVSSGDRAQ